MLRGGLRPGGPGPQPGCRAYLPCRLRFSGLKGMAGVVDPLCTMRALLVADRAPWYFAREMPKSLIASATWGLSASKSTNCWSKVAFRLLVLFGTGTCKLTQVKDLET